MNACIVEKANRIIKAAENAYVGLIDEAGYPVVSTVSPAANDGLFEIIMVTGTRSNKYKCLTGNGRCGVCFHRGGDNVTLIGDAEALADQASKDMYWRDGYREFFPKGPGDPAYVVIRFKTKRVLLWADSEAAEFTIGSLLTVQSRCGTLCAGCEDGPKNGCYGCVSNGGKPFWGECPVAKCCMEKGFNHCGECPGIPCELLNDFSCGDGEHCDRPPGSRIEICKIWAAKGCK